jgi:hypothetical protein
MSRLFYSHRLKKPLLLSDTSKKYPISGSPEPVGSSMPLYYCSLHAQLFVVKHQGWMHFSQEKIDEIRGYYELLRSANFESSYLQVIEMSCEQCAAAIRQIIRVK